MTFLLSTGKKTWKQIYRENQGIQVKTFFDKNGPTRKNVIIPDRSTDLAALLKAPRVDNFNMPVRPLLQPDQKRRTKSHPGIQQNEFVGAGPSNDFPSTVTMPLPRKKY